jgi:hypothetical protein
MLRKSLVPSALLLTITALSTMTSVAQAGEVKVPFEGKVARACEFIAKSVVAGNLTGNDSISPTQLSSKNTGGSAGSVTIKCNTEAAVSAKDYQVTGNKFDVSKAVYTVNTAKQEEASEVSVGSGETQIGVNLTLDSKTAIPAGEYSYNVLVSAVVGK